MKIENRDYILLDFLKIPFSISPGLASVRVIDKIIYALIPALQVLATASFIDTAINIYNGQAQKSQIGFPLVCILLLIAHQYITFALMGLVRSKMDISLTEAFRIAVIEKRAMLEYRHVENNETWDLIERVGKDPAGRLGSGFDIILRMIDIFFRVVAIMLVLVVQVWWAALAILAFSIPLFWLAVRSGKANYEASKEATKHTRRAQYLQGVLTERDNVEERALFAYSGELNKRYFEKYLAASKINMKVQRNRFIKMKSASLITVLISVLVAGVLIAPLGSGDISVGMFMGFVTATFGLAQMMSWELAYITSELANNREYLRDLSTFGRLSETSGALDLPADNIVSPECIEFREVSFSYPGTELMVLKNLNLTLFACKHYAFVGVNGAGKTTITKLLTGLYDNYTGDIFIDNKNLRDFSQAELKSLFSVVYQDFAKYQISMIDSIGIGNIRAISDENVTVAINNLGLSEAVSKLPEGLSTPLGRIKEKGVDLSGGEWQCVAIARSFFRSHEFIVLDEPTAAIDPIEETKIYDRFAEISKDKTAIIVTHRLGSVKLAGRILVMKDGRLVEQGKHIELITADSEYSRLYKSQEQWYKKLICSSL